MDFDNLVPDESFIGQVTSYTKGRDGNSIDKIIVHHNAGDLTLAGIVDVFNARGVSAHYQVDSQGRVGQYVELTDTAWHAGNWVANTQSIGIEHADATSDPWALSEECVDAGAHLVAALCRKYRLGRPQWEVNVWPHYDFSSTECPASIAGTQRDEYMSRAQAYYDGTAPSEPEETDRFGWTDAQRYYCFYIISTVETGCDWGATNQNDAITVGIAQWYGTRAAALIRRMKSELPDSYALLSDRIKTAIDNHTDTDSYWTKFYLENADAQSWRAASEVDGNHQLQENQFMTDLDSYRDTLRYWGVDVSNVKSTIYYISMYHQNPQGCLNVVRNYGGNRDIDTLYDAAMNSSIFGLYKNRYATVRDMLKAWDGESDPPDFGQGGGEGPGEGPTPEEPEEPSEPVESSLSYIQAVGDDLVVFGEGMATTDRMICHSTGRGIWVPRAGTIPTNPGTTVPDPNPDDPGGTPGGADPADFAAMRAVWEQYAERFAYSNASGRLDPLSSGYSDCSACIWWAANFATGNKYDWLGTRSYTIPDTCYHVVDLDWNVPELDLSEWQAGDIICMDYTLPSGYSGGHAEWYFGDGDLWSAGSAPLPKQVEFGTAASRYYRQAHQQGYVFHWLKLCRFL